MSGPRDCLYNQWSLPSDILVSRCYSGCFNTSSSSWSETLKLDRLETRNSISSVASTPFSSLIRSCEMRLSTVSSSHENSRSRTSELNSPFSSSWLKLSGDAVFLLLISILYPFQRDSMKLKHALFSSGRIWRLSIVGSLKRRRQTRFAMENVNTLSCLSLQWI